MIPELGMDYLVEVSTDQYYGPTTLGAVREFLVIGEITSDSYLTTKGRQPAAGCQIFPSSSRPCRRSSRCGRASGFRCKSGFASWKRR